MHLEIVEHFLKVLYKDAEQIAAIVVGTSVGVHATVSQGLGTPQDMLLLPIIASVAMVGVKSLVAAVVSFYAAKGLKKLQP